MYNKILTPPNIITFIRLLLVPVFAILYFALPDARWIAFICFGVACLSDVIDGYIARKYDMTSKIGTVLDPLADKLMYITVGFCLVINGTIWLAFFIVYLVKEMLMIVLAARLLKNEDEVIPSRWYGKLATALFFVIISFSIVYPAGWDTLWLNIAYAAVLVLAIYAFVRYGLTFLNIYKQKKLRKEENPDKE